MGRLRGRSSRPGTFWSAARSPSTEADLGILSPRSPQLQDHLHVECELGPLAARLRLIAGPGEQRALNSLMQSETSAHQSSRALIAAKLPSAAFHQCPGGCHPHLGHPAGEGPAPWMPSNP